MGDLFHGTFPIGYKYILLAVDYVSKWLEAIPTITCDSKVVLNFILRNILSSFGIPRVVISDEGSIFVTNCLPFFCPNLELCIECPLPITRKAMGKQKC